MESQERQFILMQSPILYLIGPTFPKECSRRLDISKTNSFPLRNRLASQQFCRLLSKQHFPFTKFRSMNKMRRQQRIVQKCRSRLHLVARKGLLVSVNLHRRKNLRYVSLSVTFKLESIHMQNKRAAILIYNPSNR